MTALEEAMRKVPGVIVFSSVVRRKPQQQRRPIIGTEEQPWCDPMPETEMRR